MVSEPRDHSSEVSRLGLPMTMVQLSLGLVPPPLESLLCSLSVWLPCSCHCCCTPARAISHELHVKVGDLNAYILVPRQVFVKPVRVSTEAACCFAGQAGSICECRCPPSSSSLILFTHTIRGVSFGSWYSILKVQCLH